MNEKGGTARRRGSPQTAQMSSGHGCALAPPEGAPPSPRKATSARMNLFKMRFGWILLNTTKDLRT